MSYKLTRFRELADLFIWSTVEVQLAIASSKSGQARRWRYPSSHVWFELTILNISLYIACLPLLRPVYQKCRTWCGSRRTKPPRQPGNINQDGIDLGDVSGVLITYQTPQETPACSDSGWEEKMQRRVTEMEIEAPFDFERPQDQDGSEEGSPIDISRLENGWMPGIRAVVTLDQNRAVRVYRTQEGCGIS